MTGRLHESYLLRQLQVDPMMLRGVCIDQVLSFGGSFWETNAAECQEDHFSMSKQVQRLDDFISHDWGAGNWRKYMALCHVYNSRDAIVFTFVLVLGVAGLIGMRILPPLTGSGSRRMSLAGHEVEVQQTSFYFPLGLVVFWLVFFFDQCIRRKVRCGGRAVFVDKACIEQSNPDQKRKGILMLAGFLAHSDRLVVLWSPHYLTRLWCVYEIATWLHIKGTLNGTVNFMPLSRALMLVIECIGFFAMFGVIKIGYHLADLITFDQLIFLSFTLHALIVVPSTDRLATDIQSLPSQLDSFAIRDSKCYCCTHSHLDPLTGTTLPCDRQLVYSAVAEWFGRETGDREAALDCFDDLVKVDVQREISGIAKYTFEDGLFFSFASFIYFLDYRLPADVPMGAWVQWRVYIVCLLGCTFPSCARLKVEMVYFFNALWTRRACGRSCLARFWQRLFMVILYVAIIWGWYLPLRRTMEWGFNLPFWGVVGSQVLLTLWLYAPRPRLDPPRIHQSFSTTGDHGVS